MVAESPPDSTEAIARCISAFKGNSCRYCDRHHNGESTPGASCREIIALAMKMITGNTHAGTVSCSMLQQTPDHPWLWFTLLRTHARSNVMNTLATLSNPAT